MPFLAPALPWIVAGTAVAGTAISLIGGIQSTSAEIQQANYQKDIASKNAVVSQENASRTEARSQAEQLAQDENSRAVLGSIIAEQGASGIRINSRSSILTRQSARALAVQDAANIRQAGDVEAHNYLMAAEDARQAAQFSGQTAANALTAGVISGAGTLVNGVSSLAAKFPTTTASSSLVGGTKVAGAAVPAARTLRFAR